MKVIVIAEIVFRLTIKILVSEDVHEMEQKRVCLIAAIPLALNKVMLVSNHVLEGLLLRKVRGIAEIVFRLLIKILVSEDVKEMEK